MKPTRRDLLRFTGAAAASLASSCMNAASSPGQLLLDDLQPRDDRYADPAHHASAILEPDSSGFLVVVSSPVARRAVAEISNGTAVVQTLEAPLDDNHTAVIAARGLESAVRYQVKVLTDTGFKALHRARTAPAISDSRPVRIAISADVDVSPEFDSDLLEHLSAAEPDVYVSLGDFPYVDNHPSPTNLSHFRERHLTARTHPRVRGWLSSMGVRAIYDDHEFANDWDAVARASEPQRYRDAMQAWDEFFPIPGRVGHIRYRSWRWGANLECFLLDVRTFRSANSSSDDSNKTLLGETQLQWLMSGIRGSTATFKLILTPVPLDFGYGADHWSGFRFERDRILAELRAVPGVLFVSADQHCLAAHRHAYGIREFQVGPLARQPLASTLAHEGVLFRSARYNFGLLDISGDQLTFSAVGVGGDVFYTETLTASQLTPA